MYLDYCHQIVYKSIVPFSRFSIFTKCCQKFSYQQHNYMFPVSTDRLLRKRSTFFHFFPLVFHLFGCLIFIDPVVEINGIGLYYWNTLLRQHLLLAIRQLCGPFFMFQQCNAPARCACKMVALQLSANTPDFIRLQYRPPNIPDLNPVDYTIWSILQERVCCCQILDIDNLKERLIYEWWHRLRSCIREKDGHFEQQI